MAIKSTQKFLMLASMFAMMSDIGSDMGFSRKTKVKDWKTYTRADWMHALRELGFEGREELRNTPFGKMEDENVEQYQIRCSLRKYIKQFDECDNELRENSLKQKENEKV